MNQFVHVFQVQLGNRQLIFEENRLLLEVTNVKKHRHKIDSSSAPFGQLASQSSADLRRNKGADIPAQAGDFLDNSRAEKGVSVFWHHENRFDSLVQFTIHQSELKFKLKIGYRAQSP